MTHELNIPTPFADFAELTENFAPRVDDERIMLPASGPAPEGEWCRFDVTLLDGSSALAGVGRIQGSYDNGEEHPPEYRFDIVLDTLQFEGMNEVMFERLVMARQSMAGGEPQTGEVSIEEAQAQADAEAAAQAQAAQPAAEGDWQEAGEDAPAADWDAGGETDWQDAGAEDDLADMASPLEAVPATSEADAYDAEPAEAYEAPVEEYAAPVEEYAAAEQAAPAEEYVAPDEAYADADLADEGFEELAPEATMAVAEEEVYAPQARPRREPAALPSPHSFEAGTLLRPSVQASWAPQPTLRPEAAQSSGLFDFEGGLPRPSAPPRPQLDPSLRIVAAPRPGAPWPRQRPVAPSAGHAEAAVATEAYAQPEAYGEEVVAEEYGEDQAYAEPAGEYEAAVDDGYEESEPQADAGFEGAVEGEGEPQDW